jgi:hypothetical protein
MYADTDAIRALGCANWTHADDLAGIAISLSSLAVAAAAASLGPVGARFLSALTEAVADGSREVTAIGDHLGMSNMTAHAVASTYDSVDGGAAERIAGA